MDHISYPLDAVLFFLDYAIWTLGHQLVLGSITSEVVHAWLAQNIQTEYMEGEH